MKSNPRKVQKGNSLCLISGGGADLIVLGTFFSERCRCVGEGPSLFFFKNLIFFVLSRLIPRGLVTLYVSPIFFCRVVCYSPHHLSLPSCMQDKICPSSEANIGSNNDFAREGIDLSCFKGDNDKNVHG